MSDGRGLAGSRRPRRLRITQVVATEQFAGTERYVVEVGGELARRGHDVVVVGGQASAMQRLLPGSVRWYPGASLSNVVSVLARGGRRDIVHSHITRADFASLAAAPLTGGRRVSTRHITAPRGYSAAAKRAARPLRALLACEIAVSGFVSDQLDVPADVVLLNGVRNEEPVTCARRPVVLIAQRLAPEKDTATALRAWASSGLAGQGWRMEIAGEGPERAALERLAGELGITGSCTFLGWLDDPTAALRMSSILFAPAPAEPCGLTVLEAMAVGTPVVAAGSGGHEETVGRVPGAALFPPGDDEAAAAHLVRLAGDGACRAAYSSALRRRQRGLLSIDAHVDRLERLYLDLSG